MSKEKKGLSPALGLIICVGIGAIIWNLPIPAGGTHQAWGLLAIFIATIAAFILRPLPMGAAALIACMVLPVMGVMKPGEALAGFANTTIWLIVAAFMFAASFIKTGLGKRIAYVLLSRFGGSSLSVAYILSATDFVVAPFTPSNTARGGGIIYPIVNSICATLGADPKNGKLAKTGAFLMFSAYAAVITSACIFLTGASNNVLCNTLAQELFGVSISWSDWFLACIVPGLILTLAQPYILYRIFNPELKQTPDTKRLARQELAEIGPMSVKEKMLTVIFLVCLVLWATSSIHHIDAVVVALMGLSAMLVLHILDWEDITHQASAWDTLVWMGALVNMASYLSKYGLMKWFANTMAAYTAGMAWMPMLIVLGIIYTFAHYLLASNSAHIAAFFAVFGGVLVAAGAPVIGVLILLGALCNSASFLTHYGCGVTPIFFGAGFISQGQWWRVGFVLTILHLLVWFCIGLPWMMAIGLF